jgi:hypothetical protein
VIPYAFENSKKMIINRNGSKYVISENSAKNFKDPCVNILKSNFH